MHPGDLEVQTYTRNFISSVLRIQCALVAKLSLVLPVPEEKQLIELVISGNERAYRQVFDAYYRELVISSYQILKDENICKDAVQEVFLELWKNRKKLHQGIILLPYLKRSVINRSLNILKSRKHHMSSGPEPLEVFKDRNRQPDEDYKVLEGKIRRSEKGSVFTLKTWIGLAASVVALFAAVFLIRPSSELQIVADADKFEVVLPDGSEVVLSNGTELSYSKNFGKQRNVELQGSALFEVVHDEDIPFEVHSPNLTTTVLGTTFFVNDKEENGTAEVQLLEGSVSVSNGKGRSVILKENQRLISDENDELSLRDQLKTQQFDWYHEGFEFDNRSLNEAIQDIADYYGVSIELNEELTGCAFTGSFNDQPLDIVLSSIAEVFGSELIKTEDGYTISNGRCE